MVTLLDSVKLNCGCALLRAAADHRGSKGLDRTRSSGRAVPMSIKCRPWCHCHLEETWWTASTWQVLGGRVLTADLVGCQYDSNERVINVFLCLHYPTVSTKALLFQAVLLERLFVRSSGQILLSRYLLNGSDNFDKFH